MSDIEQSVLSKLFTSLVIDDTWNYAAEIQVDHQMLVGVLKSLLTDDYIRDEQLSTTYWTLTEEGIQISRDGSAEFRGK